MFDGQVVREVRLAICAQGTPNIREVPEIDARGSIYGRPEDWPNVVAKCESRNF